MLFLSALLSALQSRAPAQTNQPGLVDLSFDAGNGRHGANGSVRAVVLQPDGKAIIGGQFIEVGGVERRGVARIHTNGAIDATSQPASGVDDFIYVGGFYEPTPWAVTALVDALALQADGKVVVGGVFSRVDGLARSNLMRLHADGTLDVSFHPEIGGGPRPRVRALAVQADGKILVGGEFTAAERRPRLSLARYNADGTLDSSFTPELSGEAVIESILVQTNGNILIGGRFSAVNGASRRNLARLLANGSSDASFTPGTGPSGTVRALAFDGTGNIYVGGDFTNYGALTQRSLVRIDSRGVVDPTFRLTGDSVWAEADINVLAVDVSGEITVGGNFTAMTGWTYHLGRVNADGSRNERWANAWGSVHALARQTDGAMIVAGDYYHLAGMNRTGFGRVTANGSGDPSYTPGSGLDGWVNALTVEPNGKLVAGGYFSTVAGEWRRGLTRLQADGAVDPSFTNAVSFVSVDNLIRQPDGRLLVKGAVAGTDLMDVSVQLLRLYNDGSLDSTFTALGGHLLSVALAGDGSVIAGGQFAEDATGRYVQLLRLNAGGKRDDTFRPAIEFLVEALAIQPDGKILAAGVVERECGTSVIPKLLRLHVDGEIDSSFVFSAAPGDRFGKISRLWMQPDGRLLVYGDLERIGGKAKLIRLLPNGRADSSFRLVFDNYRLHDLVALDDGKLLAVGDFYFSSFGRVLRLLGDGSIDGTFWSGTAPDLNVQTLALTGEGAVIIAGGFVTVNGMPRGLVARLFGGESPPSAPVFRVDPPYRALSWGETLRLGAVIGSVPPASLQWHVNNAAVSGATNHEHHVPSVTTADAGEYFVTATNFLGSATSSVVRVNVTGKPKLALPSSQLYGVEGGTAQIRSTVYGLPPLSYQWYFQGLPLPGATSATLTLTNLVAAQNGPYTLVVTNDVGSAAAMADLRVLLPVRFQLPVAHPEGSVELALSGSPNEFVALLTSSHLRDWRCLFYSPFYADGKLTLFDFSGETNRFYRALYPYATTP